MGHVRIVVNRAAVRELLRSDAVLQNLKQRAERIAKQAGEGMEVGTFRGQNRVRATVITATIEARLAEARDRTLTRAIDAGR